ncbi:MAG: molecular chaperone HtpG [Caldilineaceae bacterium]|nr:molecular chaperone HtpG [Caldilineaceae bacterium]
MSQTETLEYRTEVKQLLDILAHSLYTDRDIFLRELVSNASDALNRIQFEQLTNQDVLDADAPLAITITVDPEEKVITIRDTGIGMSHDELIENLGTIAHSGARTFMNQAEEGQSLEEIIGQFGVGFYSVFTVADEVAVTSRSYRPEDQAWTWRSTGDSRFELTPADKTDRGTVIEIKLKEDAAEYADAWRIEQIIRKHSDYVSFPIFVESTEAHEDATEGEAGENEEGEGGAEKPAPEPVNRRTALWRQRPSEVTDEEYNEFYKQLTYDFNDPLTRIHMVADMPVNLRAVLFVPGKREGNLLNPRSDHGLRLYSRKVLIQEHNKELLPEYLRFVDGVVDSEDLPLNVSREAVQSNPLIRRMRKALTGRLLKELKALSVSDPEKFAQFWREFGVFIKEGVATDFTDRENLIELLRFHSTTANTADAWTSLADYVTRMGGEQTEIYYVLGEDLKSAQRSPHLDYFKAHDIEVLLLVDPIDGFMMSNLREFDGKPLRNVDDAGLKLGDEEEVGESEGEEQKDAGGLDDLVTRFKQVLGDDVLDVRVSKQLVSSPSRLVSPEDSFDRDLQRVRRIMDEEYEAPRKILEINPGHPIVTDLQQMTATAPNDELIDVTITQLFDNARILDGLLTDPTDLVSRVETLMQQAVAGRLKQ